MAGSKFDELALQYVLAVENPAEVAAAAEAANLIQNSSNNRILVGQWVSSINRWISPGAGSGDRMDEGNGLDQDLISRAKALDFLASTLEVLNRDALRADQVKLLATFFGSLFSSDHRAGVAASTKALRQLTRMKAFQPAVASDIIANVSKLGEDFKLQTPTTRLELFELFKGFFADPSIVSDLSTRHGEGSIFMTGLLDLCRNERDPKNLLIWFSILETFLQSFSPSKEMLEVTFKAFSAYFPISLRASTTPLGITADDLKRAVRACFSADYRLAGLTIPFLIGKLDQGDAVTVAVKVDILQTLEACLACYEEPQQSVVPYMDKVWGSLKYEVRNGEVADTVEATLKTIAALTRRLDDESLRAFFKTAWQDLADDLANPSYAAQAGRLLVAISGATIRSFDLATSQSMPLIQKNIKNSKSLSHQQDLVILVNSLLLVRTYLEYEDSTRAELSSDGLFGDAIFADIYQRLWDEILADDATATEKNGLLQKLMEGMATLVSQRASNDQSKRLCSNSTCVSILGHLSKPAIVCPLTDTALLGSTSTPATQDALQDSAAASLTKAIPQFPEGFQQVLLLFLSTIESVLSAQTVPAGLPVSIQVAAATLSDIVCSETASESTTFATSRALTYALLQGLSKVLDIPAHLIPGKQQLVSAFVASIHLNVTKSLQTLSKVAAAQTHTQPITKEWFSQYQDTFAGSIASPDIRNSDSTLLAEFSAGSVSIFTQLLAFYLLVIRQLYLTFTRIERNTSSDSSQGPAIGISATVMEFTTNDQEVCLHRLGLLGSSVVRSLSQDEQVALSLDKEAFVLFQDISTLGSDARTFSPLDKFRTAPLAMGILQGLHSAAIENQRLVSALGDVLQHLLTPNPDFSLTTRAALDNILTILSNKHQPKGAERSSKRLEVQDSIIKSYEQIVLAEPATKGGSLWQVRAFCSILHYLAGDVARFQGNPAENKLLHHICEHATRDERYGDAFARCLGILVSPKESLSTENHAIRKRLSEQWIYHQAVQPYYSECLSPPAPQTSEGPAGDERPVLPRASRARAAAVFAILQHLKYEHYAADTAQIVRIVVGRMAALGPGQEVDSCLAVLNAILDKEPAALKEHLGPLIRGITQVYRTSIELARSGARRGQNDRSFHSNRKHALTFLCRAATVYETPHVLPYRQSLLRPLSLACGDPVREIRRLALATRQAWEALN